MPLTNMIANPFALGPLVPIFGLGVDSRFPIERPNATLLIGLSDLMQVELVTADGEVKIANECQNGDLFWALRGGGGKCAVSHSQVVGLCIELILVYQVPSVSQLASG